MSWKEVGEQVDKLEGGQGEYGGGAGDGDMLTPGGELGGEVGC